MTAILILIITSIFLHIFHIYLTMQTREDIPTLTLKPKPKRRVVRRSDEVIADEEIQKTNKQKWDPTR